MTYLLNNNTKITTELKVGAVIGVSSTFIPIIGRLSKEFNERFSSYVNPEAPFFCVLFPR